VSFLPGLGEEINIKTGGSRESGKGDEVGHSIGDPCMID